MRMPIIGLCGVKGSGKSTVAKMLTDNFNCVEVALADPIKRFVSQVFDVPQECLWGASELRDKIVKINKTTALTRVKLMQFSDHSFLGLVRSKFHILSKYILDLESEVSVRKLLQWIGSEFGRESDYDIWINEGLFVATKLLHGGYKYNPIFGLVPSFETNPYESVVISDIRFINEVVKLSQLNCVCWKIHRTNNNNNDLHISESQIDKMSRFFFDAEICQGLDTLYYRISELYKEIGR